MNEGERRPEEGSSGANLAWSIVGYQISGILVYGGLGWLLDRWLDTSFLTPIGVLGGLAAGLYLSFVRINRSNTR
jgi:ATP synthase protein I